VCTTALLFAAAVALRFPLRWRSVCGGRVFLRSLLDALGMVVYTIGLARLPLANTSAIYMTTPILLTLLAVLVLREKVPAAQWLAIALGFAGVLLVVQPATSGFSIWSLFVLLSALLIAIRDLVTRTIGNATSSLLLSISGLFMMAVFATVGGLFEHWRALRAQEFTLLAGGSALLSASYLLMTIALREGDLSVISPFRYVSLLYSALLGFILRDHVPGSLALCGMALIVSGGLWIVRRGTSTAKSATPHALAPRRRCEGGACRFDESARARGYSLACGDQSHDRRGGESPLGQ